MRTPLKALLLLSVLFWSWDIIATLVWLPHVAKFQNDPHIGSFARTGPFELLAESLLCAAFVFTCIFWLHRTQKLTPALLLLALHTYLLWQRFFAIIPICLAYSHHTHSTLWECYAKFVFAKPFLHIPQHFLFLSLFCLSVFLAVEKLTHNSANSE